MKMIMMKEKKRCRDSILGFNTIFFKLELVFFLNLDK